jgi:hypothetical protein
MNEPLPSDLSGNSVSRRILENPADRTISKGKRRTKP